jgi:hypothetical protein
VGVHVTAFHYKFKRLGGRPEIDTYRENLGSRAIRMKLKKAKILVFAIPRGSAQ